MKCVLLPLLAIFLAANAKVFPWDNTQIEWSGMTWRVKDRHVEPGPNYFTLDSVELHSNGSLTLYSKPIDDGKWTSGEIYGTEPLGHGTYSWVVESDISSLPAQIDLTLFTWEDDTWDIGNREVDIEISKFGYPEEPDNTQFAITPMQGRGGRTKRFNIQSGPEKTYFEFTWSPCGLTFRASKGNQSWNLIDNEYHYSSANETVHTTLWLIDGKAPAETNDTVCVTFESFKFTTLAETNSEYIVKC